MIPFDHVLIDSTLDDKLCLAFQLRFVLLLLAQLHQFVRFGERCSMIQSSLCLLSWPIISTIDWH